ncbi:MAG: hypothetical protein FJ387_03430 [Verrucomicrobia bacterium]|nr:hypothetical protein [Verrucomicrobiota bacterium]
MESALAYFLHRFAKAKAAGRADDFELSEEECAELFAEGTLYYYRYVHLFQLQDWKRTVRDTARNIRLFDHVRQHARRTEDQQHLEKWRPYLLRMNAVAAAMLELSEGHHPQAARLIHDAIHKLETLDELDDDTFRFERDRSLVALREMAEQLDQIRPLPEIERLERELRLAVETQAFERAARLRDRLRALRQSE